MFTIKLNIFFPWGRDESLKKALLAAESDHSSSISTGTVKIGLDDVKRSLINLGVRDDHLQSLINACPRGTIVTEIQNCHATREIKRGQLSNGRYQQDSTTAKPGPHFHLVAPTEENVRRRIEQNLLEKQKLNDRLQAVVAEIADLQQKLDQSCWTASEPERGIQLAEEDLFALEYYHGFAQASEDEKGLMLSYGMMDLCDDTQQLHESYSFLKQSLCQAYNRNYELELIVLDLQARLEDEKLAKELVEKDLEIHKDSLAEKNGHLRVQASILQGYIKETKDLKDLNSEKELLLSRLYSHIGYSQPMEEPMFSKKRKFGE